MRKLFVITITIIMILSLSGCSSDSRIDELEKRVEVLENAVGISESNEDIDTSNNEELGYTDNEEYRNAKTILLIKDFNNKEETYEGGYYQLQLRDDRCNFYYSGADYTTLTCDFSKETFDEVVDMICSQKLEKHESRTDENGKITDEIIPVMLKIDRDFIEAPANIDDIVAKFESFKDQAEPAE